MSDITDSLEQEQDKFSYCIEFAFGAMMTEASRLRLGLVPIVALGYLPDQQLAARFIGVCGDIFEALKEPSADSCPAACASEK